MLTTAYDSSIPHRCVPAKVWLHELGGEMLLGQCFGAMRIIGGLREVGTSSCGQGT